MVLFFFFFCKIVFYFIEIRDEIREIIEVEINTIRLENESSTLGLLVTAQFKVLTSLDSELHLILAGCCFDVSNFATRIHDPVCTYQYIRDGEQSSW